MSVYLDGEKDKSLRGSFLGDLVHRNWCSKLKGVHIGQNISYMDLVAPVCINADR